MWKSKKFIVLTSILASVIIFGATAGVAFAAGPNDQKPGPREALLSRVAQILGIPQEKLADAFRKASDEQRKLNLNAMLDKLLKDGKITQAQIDQFKAWLAARPAGTPRDNPEKFKEWMKSRPNIPIPGPKDFRPGMGPNKPFAPKGPPPPKTS